VTQFLVTLDRPERLDTVAPSPDAEIIAALVRGETRAFDDVYARLRAPVFAFLVRLTGRVALAEDLMQETWLRLARLAPELPPHTELRPWLFTVARNLYLSHRRWAVLDTDRLRELGLLPTPAVPSPFETLAADNTERALERAIARLPLEQREVLLLCGVSGFDPAQAARMLGVTPEAARQRLARARAKLRESLAVLEKVMP